MEYFIVRGAKKQTDVASCNQLLLFDKWSDRKITNKTVENIGAVFSSNF